jgi:hypothetical protein
MKTMIKDACNTGKFRSKFICFLMALLMLGACNEYNYDSLENDLDDLKNRVAALEEWSEAVNSNISSLQDIVAAQQNGDYVTGVTSFTSPAPGGYIISFLKSDDITIANGRDGADGKDSESTLISVKQDTDGVYYWTLNGEWITVGGNKLRVSGEKGEDGKDGIVPMIRINTDTGEWETSYDSGASWVTTEIKAKGDKGDAVFAADGVDFSNPEYVEFTLADGVSKIRLPKYKKFGLTYTQPEVFVAGETRIIAYTPVGNVAEVKFVDVPDGWQASVDPVARTFSITAPATSGSAEGKATVLVSDNDNEMIICTLNLIVSDDGGSENNSYITVEGYSGNTLTISYTDNTSEVISRNVGNVFVTSVGNKTIKYIVPEGGTTIIAGRKTDGSTIALKVSGGNLVFRNAVGGYIPIGTYSEFQLINTALNGFYRQETNIDLLNIQWIPIGDEPYDPGHGVGGLDFFGGTFDGNNHALTNLKIAGSSDNTGLFGVNKGNIRNVHIISGSVSGGIFVGGVCGYNEGSISECSNACPVSGKGFEEDTYVGGICGYNGYNGGEITSCYNTGSVSGDGYEVGGVCGENGHIITACYNTGSVSGTGNYVGGVCGNSSYGWYAETVIAACYNTGSVLGNGNYVGGVCGSISGGNVNACYNTGSVSGGRYVGGVCGLYEGSSIDVCYWKDITNDDAYSGIGHKYQSNGDASIFSSGAWPTSASHLQWGTGDGSGDGKYWKSLGSWNGGNPIYPKLWFED